MDRMDLRVGEMARRTGLTVRTLHHWDHVGLLSPSQRTAAGHRLYGLSEIGRLQTILSLRALGLSLDERGNVITEEDLLITMEKMAMIEKHFSPEQLETLKKRQEALGPEAMRASS